VSGIVATTGVDQRHLAAQAGALEGQAIAGQPQVAELGRQLHERRSLGVILQMRLVQRELRAGVGQRRVGLRRHEQERMRTQPAGAHAADVDQ
jgi:hypothetical protein